MRRLRIALLTIGLVLSASAAIPKGQDEKALEAYKKKDFQKAYLLIQKSHGYKGEQGDLGRWMGIVLYQDGQYSNAIWDLKQSLSTPHDKSAEHESWFYLALSQAKLSQWNAGLGSIKKAVELSPDRPVYFSFLSYLHNKNGQFDDALTAGKRAIELNPGDAFAYYNLGYAYGWTKQYRAANDFLQKAMEIDPRNPEYPAAMGDLFVLLEKYAEAAQAYQRAASLDTKYGAQSAIAFCAAGRYDEAVRCASQTISMLTQPRVGIGFRVIADLPTVMEVEPNSPGQRAGIEIADKIVQIGGNSTKGWSKEKVQESLKGAPGSAVRLKIKRPGEKEFLDKTVIRESMLPKEASRVLGVRSVAQRYRGGADAALQDAEQAYSLDPKEDQACLSLAAAYLDSERYGEAIKLLSALKSAQARLLEATAAIQQGKTQEAVDLYCAIPEEDMPPTNIMLAADRTALLRLFKPLADEHRAKARLLELKKQYQEALEEMSEALRLTEPADAEPLQEALFGIVRESSSALTLPEEARTHALRGEMAIKEGSFEQAAKEYRMAIRIAPYAVRLYYNIALVDAEMKSYAEAIRMMKTYLKAAPDAPDAQAAKDEIVKWEFALEKEGK